MAGAPQREQAAKVPLVQGEDRGGAVTVSISATSLRGVVTNVAAKAGSPNGTAAISMPATSFHWCHSSIRPTGARSLRFSGMPPGWPGCRPCPPPRPRARQANTRPLGGPPARRGDRPDCTASGACVSRPGGRRVVSRHATLRPLPAGQWISPSVSLIEPQAGRWARRRPGCAPNAGDHERRGV